MAAVRTEIIYEELLLRRVKAAGGAAARFRLMERLFGRGDQEGLDPCGVERLCVGEGVLQGRQTEGRGDMDDPALERYVQTLDRGAQLFRYRGGGLDRGVRKDYREDLAAITSPRDRWNADWPSAAGPGRRGPRPPAVLPRLSFTYPKWSMSHIARERSARSVRAMAFAKRRASPPPIQDTGGFVEEG